MSDTPIDTERLRALLAASTPVSCESCGALAEVKLEDGSGWCSACHESALSMDYDGDGGEPIEWRDILAEFHSLLPGLLGEVERLSAENDALWDDVLRAVTERNEVAERAAAEFIPGPDGQDGIDRRALVQQWMDDGRDGAESWRTSWQKAAERAVAAEAEVERLRAERTSWAGTAADLNGFLRDLVLDVLNEVAGAGDALRPVLDLAGTMGLHLDDEVADAAKRAVAAAKAEATSDPEGAET